MVPFIKLLPVYPFWDSPGEIEKNHSYALSELLQKQEWLVGIIL